MQKLASEPKKLEDRQMACKAGMLNIHDLKKKKGGARKKREKKLPTFVLLLSRSLSSRRRVEKTCYIQLVAGRRKARSAQRVPARVDELGGEWTADTGRGVVQGLWGDRSSATGPTRSTSHSELCSDHLRQAPALT